MNGNELFVGVWNMKNVVKMKRARRSGKNRFTGMSYLHTCVVCSSYLINAMVVLMHGKLFKLTRDVACGPGVQIPIRICSSQGRGHASHMGV
jgi:hypothetical protein